MAFYQPSTSAFKSVIQTHLGDQKRLNYIEFLKDFARLTYDPVTEMYPMYVEKAMSYFHIGKDYRVAQVKLDFSTLRGSW